MLEVTIMEPTTAEVTDCIVDLSNSPDECTFSVLGNILAGDNILFQEADPTLTWRSIVNDAEVQALNVSNTTKVTVSKLRMRIYKPATTNAVGVRLTR